MDFYPYSAPIILTDTIFALYGGHTGSSVAAQRQAAYLIAEMAASDDIGSFLLPTIVTGTYIYNPFQRFVLGHSYVHRIIQTRFISQDETVFDTVLGTANDDVTLLNDEYGTVIIQNDNYPFKVEFAYEAGLPSGTSFKPDVLLGLTTYADIILNEILGYGNESPGDIGVQSFKTIDYTEARVALIKTGFGSSARAQFVRKLFTKLRKHRQVGL